MGSPAREMFMTGHYLIRFGARAEGTGGGSLPWSGLHGLVNEKGGHCSAFFSYSIEMPAPLRIDSNADRPQISYGWYPNNPSSNSPYLYSGRVVGNYYSFPPWGNYLYAGVLQNNKLLQTYAPLTDGSHVDMTYFGNSSDDDQIRFIVHYYSYRKIPVNQNQVYVVVGDQAYPMEEVVCSDLEDVHVMCTFEYQMVKPGCVPYHFEATDVNGLTSYLPGSARWGIRRFMTTTQARSAPNATTECPDLFVGLPTFPTDTRSGYVNSTIDEWYPTIDHRTTDQVVMPTSPRPAAYSGGLYQFPISVTVTGLDLLNIQEVLLDAATTLGIDVDRILITTEWNATDRNIFIITVSLVAATPGDGSAQTDGERLRAEIINPTSTPSAAGRNSTEAASITNACQSSCTLGSVGDAVYFAGAVQPTNPSPSTPPSSSPSSITAVSVWLLVATLLVAAVCG